MCQQHQIFFCQHNYTMYLNDISYDLFCWLTYIQNGDLFPGKYNLFTALSTIAKLHSRPGLKASTRLRSCIFTLFVLFSPFSVCLFSSRHWTGLQQQQQLQPISTNLTLSPKKGYLYNHFQQHLKDCQVRAAGGSI